MNALSSLAHQHASSAALQQAIEAACRRIAPNWPLDRFIAVNPWWGFIEQPIKAATKRIGHLCGSHSTMPMDWYIERYKEGQIDEGVLREVLHGKGLKPDASAFIQRCSIMESKPSRMMLLSDAIDLQRNPHKQVPCHDIIINAIGQHCASWFDRGQARWHPASGTSLYQAWRDTAAHDDGPSLLSGIPGIANRIAGLPDDHEELFRQACMRLDIGVDERENFFLALLFSVNGWASWCAYLRWQAGLRGESDDHAAQLLAIRLAWEYVMADCVDDTGIVQDWKAKRKFDAPTTEFSQAWIWQEALERTWQRRVNAGIAAAPRGTPQSGRPPLQAVFCIDVRSERMRRALEACDSSISTHGFAGFFGMPIEYLPLGAHEPRPQLPGLLAPKMRAVSCAPTPADTERLRSKRFTRVGLARAFHGLRTAAVSGFGMVETTGLGYAWKLVRASLNGSDTSVSDGFALRPSERARLRPQLEGLSLEQKVTLAAGALGGMSLRSNFAPLVLLAGHGSQSANNPHAAGLDCGACCGQTGEVNARILAGLLNDPKVRAGLAQKGFAIADDTLFVAALHNTTTDEIALFDTDEVAASHQAALAQARTWLKEAGRRIRAERAPALGLAGVDANGLLAELQQRSRDWSQVRPEWGLANNAAFIAAPRERTRHMNLQGRSFLHDYRHADDHDKSILELILTAPVVVAHWINMQYYASTVDNLRWGSGNKVLHNVVGGNIGVFEGNGGDLRIGLPLQSLHDGQRWMHTPQRLSVWIEAPAEAIMQVVLRHDTVRRLVEGEWIHLFCIDPEDGAVLRCSSGGPGRLAWVAEQSAA